MVSGDPGAGDEQDARALRADEPRGWRFVGTRPELDKLTRLEAQTARLEEGRYLVPA